MIEVLDLYVRYGRGREYVVKGVSTTFDGRTLLLGPNGSGKTTLFRAITGLAPVSSGRILIDGEEAEGIRGRPGVLAANLAEVYSVGRLSAYDHLRLFMDLTGGSVDRALELLGQLGVGKDLLRKRRPWELSAGQRKAFTTAAAIAAGARHVLLDEPFEQLDPARKSKLLGVLGELGGVVVINTHETWLLEALRGWRAMLMFEGRLYGPLTVDELLGAGLVVGEDPRALLTFEAGGRRYSLVSGGGEPLSRMVTLDRVYEVGAAR